MRKIEPEGKGDLYFEIECVNGKWHALKDGLLPESVQAELKDVPTDTCVEIGIHILRYNEDLCDYDLFNTVLRVHVKEGDKFTQVKESNLSNRAGNDLCVLFDNKLRKIDVDYPDYPSYEDEVSYQADLKGDQMREERNANA